MSASDANEPDLLDETTCGRVVADSGVVVFRWNAATDRMAWSAGAEAVLGIDPADLPRTSRALRGLLTADTATARAPLPALAEAARLDGPAARYQIRYVLKPQATLAGLPSHLEECGHWVFGPDGSVLGAEGVIRPVPASDPALAAIRSTHDRMTGLLQRDSLMAALDQTIEDLTRTRQGSAAYMVIAIDDLSRINANFGYEIGDRIIAATAQRISRRMRNGDTLGHISERRFGAIIRNCSETALAVAADRFRSAIADELIVTADAEVQATVSIGAVLLPRHAAEADKAALRAEEALSDVRATMRGGYRLYAPSAERDQLRRRNLELAHEIVRGLDEDRFVLAYQPVIDARTREVVSYEALSRLVLDDGTVISAGPLIATAERLGMVKRIDERALELALADLDANPGLRLAVNVSVETLAEPVWFARLVEAIRANRSIARRLTVEITETAAIGNLDEVAGLSQTLRDLGCKVAIDDFGTGHTSFNALRALSFDWLKIDGSYIRDLRTNPDSVVFAQTLVTLAKHFRINVLAEWVQDEESAAMLAAMGVDALQGRLAGDPMLRVTPLTERVLTGPDRPAPRAPAGQYSFCGLSTGPLGIEPAPAEVSAA